MLRQATAWTATILIGAALGLGTALGALAFARGSASESYGPWAHSRLAGAVAADPYTRAIVAREGLLALSAREALYFTLSRDQDGHVLQEACVYELTSPRLAARWWSVTLYGRDNFLVRNSDHSASIDASRTVTEPDGAWRARISPVRGDAVNWLSSRDARRGFTLILRVYNPQQRFRRAEDALPRLARLSCAGAT